MVDNDNLSKQLQILEEQIRNSSIPQDLAEKTLARLSRIGKFGSSSIDEFDSAADYIECIAGLPWNKTSDDILDLEFARKSLDKNHFGLEDIKDRILEYISIIKLNKERGTKVQAPILCFVGLAGTGKTTVAYSIAEGLGKKFYRIPLGGMGDPLDLRGMSKIHPEAEPGKIIKALRKVGNKNPVILLDEIDRVDETKRAAVMGVLLELLDPEQNPTFSDYYVDYPFDLSQVLFVTTANNTTNIATAVLDRLEVIYMPSYSDEQKIHIGKNYMLPKVVKNSGLPEGSLTIEDSLWVNIVRPLGFDSGMRTLERTVEGITRKVAREVVEGKVQRVHLSEQNIKQYLPR